MKRTIQVEVNVCQNCDKETDYQYECDSCGNAYCFDCYKKCGQEYSHGLYISGSGDGFFCTACLLAPQKYTKELLEAYQRIAALRIESQAYSEDISKRAKALESKIKTIRENLGLK